MIPSLMPPTSACPTQYSTADLVEVVKLVEDDYREGDATSAVTNRAALEARLSCTADLLSADSLARIHLAEALTSHLEGRDDRAREALAGVFAAQPGFQLPEDLLPPGDPVRQLLPGALLALRDDPGAGIPVLDHGYVEVDAVSGVVAPTQRAAVVQQLDGQQTLVATHYRWPDEAGWDWLDEVPQAAPREALPRPAADPHAVRRPRHVGLVVAATGSAVVAGSCFAASAYGYGRYQDTEALAPDANASARDQYRSELERRARTINGATIGGVVASAAALTVGIGWVLRW